MKRSAERILTTHVGSLPRPADLRAMWAKKAVTAEDEAALQMRLRSAVGEVVRAQKDVGIDIPNDGEFGKSTSWSLYVLKRLSGFDMREVKGANPFARGADRAKFREFYDELEGRGDGKDWSNVTRFDAVCVGDIKYNGLFELQRPKVRATDWVWIVDHTIQLFKQFILSQAMT
jgi:5-methyltetrahydropteroyltriglutamate--homocysteine methyltransferase